MVCQYFDERTTDFGSSRMLNIKKSQAASQCGFALIEALISLLIISFGLLGMAGLQIKLTTLEIESYERSQALILAKDIAARFTSNAKAAGDYDISTGNSEEIFIGTNGVSLDECTSAPIDITEASSAQSARLAICDLKNWEDSLKGIAEGGSSALAEPRGCIEATGTANEYRVSVTWRGMTGTVAPAVACGSSQYEDQTLRRAINLVVRVPDLNCNSIKATGC